MNAEKMKNSELVEVGFEQINLKVGVAMQMQQKALASPVNHNVQYIGAIPGVSFLITLPRVDDGPIWLRQGSKATFRALVGTHIYAFNTSVLRARSRPSSYAHFAIPEVVHSRSVRRHPRVETRLPVEITRADATRSMAIMYDLSLRGATLELVGVLASPGDTISIDLPLILPELTRKLELTAVVRNCGDYLASVAKGRFRYGVEFVEVSEDDSMLVHYFVDHLIAELHARF